MAGRQCKAFALSVEQRYSGLGRVRFSMSNKASRSGDFKKDIMKNEKKYRS